MASAGTATIHPANGYANLQIRPYASTIDLCDMSNYHLDLSFNLMLV
jgi:hypothetical protein